MRSLEKRLAIDGRAGAERAVWTEVEVLSTSTARRLELRGGPSEEPLLVRGGAGSPSFFRRQSFESLRLITLILTHLALSLLLFACSNFRSSSLRIDSSPSFLLVSSITSSVLMVDLPACFAKDSRSIAAFPSERSAQ